MRILKGNKKENWMKLKLENRNDIWEIEKIVEEDDWLSGRTMRRKMIQRKDSTEKGNKIPVNLEIKVEKVKYHEQTGNLRITGPITKGPDDIDIGNYHTFSLEPGKVINIRKPQDWKKWQIELIKRAFKKPPQVLVCVLDRDTATLAEVSNRINIITEIETTGGGKQYKDQERQQYLGEIKSILNRKKENYENIVIAGPGFEKENLLNNIKEDEEELFKKCIKVSTSQTGETGINEVVRRGTLDKIIKNSRVSKETKAVDDLFEKLSQGSKKITYGEEHVKKAVEMGAVKKLLVTDRKIKSFKNLSKDAENKGAKITIVSEDHEAGEKLGNMGGIAAILRYQID